MPKRDQSQEALRQVEQITDSKPVLGEIRADKAAVLRIIRETGEAFADYMQANFAICHVSASNSMSNGSTSVAMLAG